MSVTAQARTCVRAAFRATCAPDTMAARRRPPRRPPKRAPQGVSLVELLVGMTVGLFLTMGLLVMMAGTSRGFKTQDEFARMQEGGVEALRYIGDSLRLAGFYGWNGSPGGATSVALPALAPGGGQEIDTLDDCGSANNLPAVNWALQVGTALFGRMGLTPANVNTDFPCIRAQNFLDYLNHQILVVRGSNGSQVVDPAISPMPPSTTIACMCSPIRHAASSSAAGLRASPR